MLASGNGLARGRGSEVWLMNRIGGLWRELRLYGNPLRRACDRTEAALLACLLSAFVVMVPLVAAITGAQAYGTGLRAERAERAAWRQVPAVLMVASPAPGYGGYEAPVRARWTAPDGAKRAGGITAPPGTRAGHTVMLWVDASGQPTGVPLQQVQVTGQAIDAAAIAAIAVFSALLCAGVLGRWVLFRRRLAAWDAEWRAVGPRWTSLR
jgi:hypothetical protein